jgi:peptidoglycan/xylan/chitin deacetylase (PgdA/CDA1 family)
MKPDRSAAVAREILKDLGLVDGLSYFSFPETGSWKTEDLSFLPSKITDVILKRPETTTFPILAKFSTQHISGEAICNLSDGTPAITIDDETLRFAFDPFATHLMNLNEEFQKSRMDGLRRLALATYCQMPPPLRNTLRWAARRYNTSHVQSVRDLELIGASSNVIVHLFEQHLQENGLLDKHHKPPLAVVTHDIDTEFCQSEGREIVSSVENAERVNATWFFVPRSFQYSLDTGAVRNLAEEGHEIGMHGFAHDGRLALNNPTKLATQLRKGRIILESTGAKVQSFRSPWILRSMQLPITLASVGFKIDSSYPDVDMFSMAGRRKGLSYNRPFRPMFAKNESLIERLPIWEVPITSPQDVHLMEDLRVTDEQLLHIWRYKADFCRDFGGVFVLHTHPTHLVKYIQQYTEFLRILRKNGYRFITLRDLPDFLEPKSG